MRKINKIINKLRIYIPNIELIITYELKRLRVWVRDFKIFQLVYDKQNNFINVTIFNKVFVWSLKNEEKS